MVSIKDFIKITSNLWEIPKNFRSDMRVPARVYASPTMLEDIFNEKAIEQLINISTLMGIEGHALAMPDIHQGYGFPIGGVAAIEAKDGIISPGGVGYDINCGVRLLASNYHHDEIKHQIEKLARKMQRNVPSGVGRGGSFVLSDHDLDNVLNDGISWAMKKGHATQYDQEMTEENGHYKAADAGCVSSHAKQRGKDQLGTLGAGNHFLEVQRVVEIYDDKIASAFGLFKDQITIMIHTGSRGLGHQVCTDYVRIMNRIKSSGIIIPDSELACAKLESSEGQNYFHAMAAAANFAWVNRQIITNLVRQAWGDVFGDEKDQLKIVYDVAHNIAKLEIHDNKKLLVHRKGATRAFGPNHVDLPSKYQEVGQPVFIPGSMGTYSYVLAGTEKAMKDTFGSTCHGAGRRMSRTKSRKTMGISQILRELENYGVVVCASSMQGLVEEAPEAYKDVDSVVDVVHQEGISKKVAKLKPVAIIKG